jgi:hypothetical protein
MEDETVEETAPVVEPVAVETPAPGAKPRRQRRVVRPADGPPAEKKRPGRPKKNVAATAVEMLGITPEPLTPGNSVELVYTSPGMFKKLSHMLAQFGVSEVNLTFTPAGLSIATDDHFSRCRIYATIDGRYMSQYYCRETISVQVNRAALGVVLGNIDTSHYKISFSIAADVSTSLNIVLRDLTYESDAQYKLTVLPTTLPEETSTPDDTDYPVKFRLTSKYFKTLITRSKTLGRQFTIQMVGGGPLTFATPEAKWQVGWKGTYDPALINLRSTLPLGEPFSVSVMISYITPFSLSLIGTNVDIAVHPTDKMSFSSTIDEKEGGGQAFIVKVYATIVQIPTQQIEAAPEEQVTG